MNTPVREGETIEGFTRNRPYQVLKCSRNKKINTSDSNHERATADCPGALGANQVAHQRVLDW